MNFYGELLQAFRWFNDNLDVLFFIYGLSFFILGISIQFSARKVSGFKFAQVLWLLSCFGIAYGGNQFLEMWGIIKGRNSALEIISFTFLVSSYLFLVELARRLLLISATHKKTLYFFRIWTAPALLAVVLLTGFVLKDFLRYGEILARYLFGLTGGMITGIGLLLYYGSEKASLGKLNARKYFVFAGISFFCGAFIEVVSVPPANFFPADRLNNESFFLKTGIPVQILSSFCALFLAWTVIRILDIFKWEVMNVYSTSRKTKQRFEEFEKRYWDIVENSSDIIHSVNADGFILNTNRRASELLGYSKKELIGKHISEIYDPAIWKNVENGFEKLKREGHLLVEDGRMIKKNGEKIEVTINSSVVYDHSGNFVKTRTIIKDITEHVRYEKLMEHRLKFEKTMSRIMSRFIGVYKMDAAINASLCDIGVLSGVGRAYLFLINEKGNEISNTHEWCAPGVLAQKANLQNVPISAFPWWFGKLFNGEVIHIKDVSKLPPKAKAEKELLESHDIKSLLVLPLFINKRLFGFVGFDNVVETTERSFHDYNLLRMFSNILKNAFERKIIEKEKEKLQEQLIQSAKMGTMGVMASGIAHELNNPLTAVIGNIQLLLGETPQDSRMYKDLKDTDEAAKRCKELVSQLLLFSRQVNSKRESADINEIVKNSINMGLRPIDRSNINIIRQFGNNLPPVLCNVQQMEQVFVNLIQNSRDAMPEGGIIEITTSSSNGHVSVALKDTGGGIPQEIAGRIFDPFFTTKPIGKGTGLGLSICRKIIDKHNGKIDFRSDEGAGAVFIVVLPAVLS